MSTIHQSMSIRYWISPTAICAASTASIGIAQQEVRGSGGRASQIASTSERDAEHGRRADVHPHRARRTSRAAGSASSSKLPGKRPAAVANVPVTTSTAHEMPTSSAELPEPYAARPRRGRSRPRAPRSRRACSSTTESRKCESTSQRVEVEVDRDRAERRLGERAEERRERDAARPRRHRRRPRATRATSTSVSRIVMPGDEAVRELDLLVVVARGQLRRALAARPFRAAEARTRSGARSRRSTRSRAASARWRARSAECPRRDRERAHAGQRRRHRPHCSGAASGRPLHRRERRPEEAAAGRSVAARPIRRTTRVLRATTARLRRPRLVQRCSPCGSEQDADPKTSERLGAQLRTRSDVLESRARWTRMTIRSAREDEAAARRPAQAIVTIVSIRRLPISSASLVATVFTSSRGLEPEVLESLGCGSIRGWLRGGRPRGAGRDRPARPRLRLGASRMRAGERVLGFAERGLGLVEAALLEQRAAEDEARVADLVQAVLARRRAAPAPRGRAPRPSRCSPVRRCTWASDEIVVAASMSSPCSSAIATASFSRAIASSGLPSRNSSPPRLLSSRPT